MSKLTLVCHAWMDDSNYGDHIATRELKTFARVANEELDRDVIAIDPSKCVAYVSDHDFNGLEFDLVVFWSKDANLAVRAAARRAERVFVVIPDPNWAANVDLGREFILVTPFERLDGFSAKDATAALAKYDVKTDDASEHIFLPFGEMALHDPRYMRDFTQAAAPQPSRLPMSRANAEYAYAGSLKKNRAKMMANYAAIGDCDLFGRFTPRDLEPYYDGSVGSFTTLNKHVFGHVAPMSVWRVYAAHDGAIVVSDPAMTDLRTHYMRPLEYALADVKLKFVGDNEADIKDDKNYYEARVIDDATGRASLRKMRASYDMDFVDRVVSALS